MTDSRNQPELENLGYEPECECVGCKEEKQAASAPLATLGFNSHVIEPESRVNKVEDVSQPLEQPNPKIIGD